MLIDNYKRRMLGSHPLGTYYISLQQLIFKCIERKAIVRCFLLGSDTRWLMIYFDGVWVSYFLSDTHKKSLIALLTGKQKRLFEKLHYSTCVGRSLGLLANSHLVAHLF